MTSLAAETLKVGETVKAAFDYAAKQTDELTVSEGDILTIVSVRDDGWGEAQLDDKKGLLPLNYVAKLTEDESKELAEIGGAAAGSAESGSSYAVSASATKDVSAIMSLDAEDESLRRYKESLLGAAAGGDLGDTSDPRRVVVTEFRVIFEDAGKEDLVFNIESAAGLKDLAEKAFVMKEKSNYRFQISFRVQHEIVAGLKFTNTIKKSVFTDKEDIMIGSYPPQKDPHQFVFPRHGWNETPSGMMYRGGYTGLGTFTDSDGVKHSEFKYKFKITK